MSVWLILSSLLRIRRRTVGTPGGRAATRANISQNEEGKQGQQAMECFHSGRIV